MIRFSVQPLRSAKPSPGLCSQVISSTSRYSTSKDGGAEESLEKSSSVHESSQKTTSLLDQDNEAKTATSKSATLTQVEQDEQLRQKLAAMSGEGDAGIEYEDGKPVSMKRSVRNNMFRYI